MHSYSKYLNTKKRAHRKMLPQRVLLLFFVYILLFLVRDGFGQFPSVCNTHENLQNKRCCPNNCGSDSDRGSCVDVTSQAMTQASNSNDTILAVLRDSASKTYKGTIDSRYLWPTMVFQNVCNCTGNYYGPDCSECNFGWTGATCSERAPNITRKDFRQLTSVEKTAFFNGLNKLKNEMAPLNWSVITQEPADDSGRVTLENVTTYNYLVYIHNYVSRDASNSCRELNGGVNVDFAHSGPNFPVWHRTYILILEKAMQRVLGNSSFRFPYWSWETNHNILAEDSKELGRAMGNQNARQGERRDMDFTNGIIKKWNTVCDITYTKTLTFSQKGKIYGSSLTYEEKQSFSQANKTLRYETLCKEFWKPCNVTDDLIHGRNLQRGKEERYLPGLHEVQMAIAAPEYDAAGSDDTYSMNVHTDSFRGRLEGWTFLCSASNCVAPFLSKDYQRMHNVVHGWVDGHMSVPPSAVNDPVFSLHHCNIDRILESWMKRFYSKNESLPPYNISGGHIGHNRDDYMVPFFPLITPGQQYSRASDWGYEYDTLIKDDIEDSNIKNCSHLIGNSMVREDYSDSKRYPEAENNCHICKADSKCTYYVYQGKNSTLNPYAGRCDDNQCQTTPATTRSTSRPRPPGSGAAKPTFKLTLLATALLFTITGFSLHF